MKKLPKELRPLRFGAFRKLDGESEYNLEPRPSAVGTFIGFLFMVIFAGLFVFTLWYLLKG